MLSFPYILIVFSKNLTLTLITLTGGFLPTQYKPLSHLQNLTTIFNFALNENLLEKSTLSKYREISSFPLFFSFRSSLVRIGT